MKNKKRKIKIKSGQKKQKSDQPLKIAVVTSSFNREITEKLESAAVKYLVGLGVEVFSVNVPGAIEIPLTIKTLIRSHKVDGAVALGAVIRGDTTHYEEVCRSVERGLTTLMLETETPIGFGVLTTENEEQAMARAGGEHGNKGLDAAQVTVEMIGLLNDIKSGKLES